MAGSALAYAGAVLGYVAIRPLLEAPRGWLELVDDLEPWAYLPAPLVAGAGTLLGVPAAIAAGAGVMAAFGLRWGHRYLRPAARPEALAADLTVMTFNTLAWQRQGQDIAAAILHWAPDVVGLQEIGPRGAEYLARTLADHYPFSYLTPAADASGVAVLSRYPLLEASAFRPGEHAHWWQRFVLDTPRGPITYINLHTRIPYIRTTHRRFGFVRLPREFHSERRRREIDVLIELLRQIDGPVLVTGDFNMTERSGDHRRLSTYLQDAYRAVGRGLGHTFPRLGAFPRSFPAPWPVVRLDYVWHSDHFQAVWAQVGDAGHSDHHPVIAGLRWSEPAAEAEIAVPIAASAV